MSPLLESTKIFTTRCSMYATKAKNPTHCLQKASAKDTTYYPQGNATQQQNELCYENSGVMLYRKQVSIINAYHVLDLFSGAGGLSLGFLQTGRVRIVAAAENNPNARKTYKRNFGVLHVYSNVRSIDYKELQSTLGHIDIVVGGPPCQGFSNANRQQSSIISMNNRLVKEFVRAICELKPKAFVMENVAMFKSHIHRFLVDEDDLNDDRIMSMNLRNDEVEILPAEVTFKGATELLTSICTRTEPTWDESFYKTINVLYRHRKNQSTFNVTLKKHKRNISQLLKAIKASEHDLRKSITHSHDIAMADSILKYGECKQNFQEVTQAIEKSLFLQRALLRLKELSRNKIHVYDYGESNGAVVAQVKSYAIREYLRSTLESNPYDYRIHEETLNALHYGVPQRRERYIIVGFSSEYKEPYSMEEAKYNDKNCRTVRDAIGDLQKIEPSRSVDSEPVILNPLPEVEGLAKELRGKVLHNHVTTATRDTALLRFKALKEGQNFHDLSPELKTTYSNAERTQNTIYMRLKYDEPSGTVVNVRKSMWIHPELDRAISIREAARLQTFPDSFIFEGTKDSQYQQIGNAVPPLLARAIAKGVINVLDSKKSESLASIL